MKRTLSSPNDRAYRHTRLGAAIKGAVIWVCLCAPSGSFAQTSNGFSNDLGAILGPATEFATARPALARPGFVSDQDMRNLLFLIVEINGRSNGKSFDVEFDFDTGHLWMDSNDLREAGIRPPAGFRGRTRLDQIPGISARYDVLRQALVVAAIPEAMMPRIIGARPRRDLPEVQTGFGLVLNYRLTADLGDDLFGAGPDLGNGYLALDGRIFTPMGVLKNNVGLSFAKAGENRKQFRRFETSFTVAMPERLVTVTVGDFVSSSLPWARPVRMGGIQLRRDFSLGENIVTSPPLSFSGTAAVPSSVDVFVGGIRAFSGQVEPGPFVLTDLPFVTSSGEAEIVIRDEAGIERVVQLPFFASQNLIRAGTLDFALQIGRSRRAFGVENFSYDTTTSGALSLRYGVTDALTLEGHIEGNRELLAFGHGLSAILFDRAEVSLAAGGSTNAGVKGAFVQAGLRTTVGMVNLNMSSRRTFGDFRDLAYIGGVAALGEGATEDQFAALRPSDALDVISIGLPRIGGTEGSLGLSYINSLRGETRDRILSASYSHRLGKRGAHLQVNGFRAFGLAEGFGVSASFSMPLGGGHIASANAARSQRGKPNPSIGLSRPMGSQIGAVGYALRMEGTGADRVADLRLTKNMAFGRAELIARENRGKLGAQASFSGAFVAAGGGVFAAPEIADAFAVVNVGMPGVLINLQNRPVTKTGGSGRALVSGLQSYQRNRISIVIPDDLPLDAGIAASSRDVVPALNSGVTVNFGIETGRAALLELRHADGSFVEVGSQAILNGGAEEAIIGYDGLVWFTRLTATNTVLVRMGNESCTSRFTFTPSSDQQRSIETVECLP